MTLSSEVEVRHIGGHSTGLLDDIYMDIITVRGSDGYAPGARLDGERVRLVDTDRFSFLDTLTDQRCRARTSCEGRQSGDCSSGEETPASRLVTHISMTVLDTPITEPSPVQWADEQSIIILVCLLRYLRERPTYTIRCL